MDKTIAIDGFYSYNNIDRKILEADCDDVLFDTRINSLDSNVEKWLETFDDSDKKIFLELLSKYTYLTYPAFLELIKKNLITVREKIQIPYEKMIFVTVESETGQKSGGDEVAVGIHKKFMGHIDKRNIIRSVTRAGDDILEGVKAIVFVDDLVATGFTAFRCIKAFLERFSSAIAPDTRLILAPVAITRRGEKYIRRKSRECSIDLEIIHNGFQTSAFRGGYVFDGKSAKAAQEIVAQYEQIIGKEEDKSFVFGFGECKLLFSTYYDTANNTLCTFWKTTDSHTPVFERQGQKKRPSISELKQVSRKAMSVAYDTASEKNKK